MDTKEPSDSDELTSDIFILGETVPPREDDSFFNATRLCRIGEKKWTDWRKQIATKKFLAELGKVYSFPLIKASRGMETFVHREVALELVKWLIPNEFTQATSMEERFAQCQADNCKLLERNRVLMTHITFCLTELEKQKQELCEATSRMELDEKTRQTELNAAKTELGFLEMEVWYLESENGSLKKDLSDSENYVNNIKEQLHNVETENISLQIELNSYKMN